MGLIVRMALSPRSPNPVAFAQLLETMDGACTMTNTADPYGAQNHARAMAGIVVDAMPTLPAASADDRPAQVAASDMLWAETIAGGGYAARCLARGSRLQLSDRDGDACVSMLMFNAEQPVERLNVADTMKVQWNAYPGAGSVLLSDMGRVMASILIDETAGPDLFCGASNAATNAQRYGDGANFGHQPNARDRFALATAKFGLSRRDIHPCANWFKTIRIDDGGAIAMDAAPYGPGRTVTLRVEMDVIVMLANCPHILDARETYQVSPARVLAWRGVAAPIDDPIRLSTPERMRAFLNTDDFYLR